VRPAGRIRGVRPKLIPARSDVEWRSRCLRDAGFTRETAQWVACQTSFDLHALLELIDRGCPPEPALRIVAPLDWGEGAS
jgi:hypothetical protein